MIAEPVNFFWFRRDLRIQDNSGLFHALSEGIKVQCVFIFDTNILDKLENRRDRRLVFIHRSLEALNRELNKFNSGLITGYGDPVSVWKEWTEKFFVRNVYTNRDYEPYAKQRDVAVATLLKSHGIGFHTYKDQVIFEGDEILKDDGTPYSVFTPYKRKYLSRITPSHYNAFPLIKFKDRFVLSAPGKLLSPEETGFQDFVFPFPGNKLPEDTLAHYAADRDFPARNGTSKLSVHLRFGTISIREIFGKAIAAGSEIYLNELIWRDFYQMILFNYPEVVHEPFRKEFNRIPWRNNPEEFKRWQAGETGYPLVDAGMRELFQTGYMHNRVRMVTASFLVKHLLIDWRWGEAWFAEQLLDFDLASNNGGWQWAAGCGCDAAPYFRIFNPAEQARKFDPQLEYIRKWVPEFETPSYPEPIVEHKFARERCLQHFKKHLNANH